MQLAANGPDLTGLTMNCSPVLDCSCSRVSRVCGRRNTAACRARSESIAERKCSRCNTSIALHRRCSWRMPRKIKHIPTSTERAEQRRKVICGTKDPERKQSRVQRSAPERGPRPNRDGLNFRVETHGISPFRYLAVTRVNILIDVSYAARVTTYAMHAWLRPAEARVARGILAWQSNAWPS